MATPKYGTTPQSKRSINGPTKHVGSKVTKLKGKTRRRVAVVKDGPCPTSLLVPLMVRCAFQDIRLTVRAERMADVGVEGVRVGGERVVGVGGVGV